MGVIKDFRGRKNVEFIKSSDLPEMGVVTIDSMRIEDWCDSPIVYFSKLGVKTKFKTVANFQLTKIFEVLQQESNNERNAFIIDDTGHFEMRTSKKGKNYVYFVVDD